MVQPGLEPWTSGVEDQDITRLRHHYADKVPFMLKHKLLVLMVI